VTQIERSSRKVISGSGWANPLSHSFYLENSSHLKVYSNVEGVLEQLTLGVDYSISGVGDDNGYEVTITTPGDWDPTSWVLSVEPPIDQPADISLGGTFGERFEAALDRVSNRIQHVYDMAARAIKSPLSTDPATLDQDDLVVDPATLQDLEGSVAAAAASAAAAATAETNAETAETNAETAETNAETAQAAAQAAQAAAEAAAASIGGPMIFQGVWDASAGTFPGTVGRKKGWTYIVSVAGTVGGQAFEVNDKLVALVDTASTTVYAANWFRLEADLVQAVAGLQGDISAAALRAALPVLEALAANRTYYVRADGSDSNTGLVNNAGGAFLTIQKAINTVAAINIGSFSVTISVADGTYTGAIAVVGPWLGTGTVSIVGNTGTPANVVISVTSNNAITVSAGGRLNVSGVKIQTTTSGVGIFSDTNGLITMNGAFEIGACATYHMLAQSGGAIVISANYTISGNSLYHWIANGGGLISAISLTITLTGTPAFSSRFAYSSRVASIQCHLNTFSGAATGTRFEVDTGGSIFTNNAALTYLPGNAAGLLTQGGVYDKLAGHGAPVTKTADFTVADSENYLINNKAGSNCTATLPTAANYTGRRIVIKNLQAFTVISASSNVVPLAGGAAGTAILSATAGRWAELVSDGTNWIIVAGVT
jgi:hypothetical protein